MIAAAGYRSDVLRPAVFHHGYANSFCSILTGVVVQIMTAVVGGIIIDSFARLRTTADAIESARANVCYVCSFTRDVLDGMAKHG